MSEVVIEGLRKMYGAVAAIDDVTLTIPSGQLVSLLGPSGCGKTTTLNCIAGLELPDAGVIRAGEVVLTDMGRRHALAPERRQLGMVFQSYALWPHMTVRDNLAFGLKLRKVAKTEQQRRIDEALDLVGLGGLADRYPFQLSGGQQQRVALARAVVVEPQVLLLDEPLSNLDKNLRVQMRDELKNLQRTLGLTTIFVTHDQEEAMTTADRMAVLDKGVLQQVGKAVELFDFPANRFVAGFVGTANLLEGQVRQVSAGGVDFDATGVGRLVLPAAAGQAPQAGPATLAFRPHSVDIRPRDAHVDALRNWLDGHVVSSEFLGETSRYRVKVGEALIVANQRHYAGRSLFQPGEEVRLGIESSQLRLLVQ